MTLHPIRNIIRSRRIAARVVATLEQADIPVRVLHNCIQIWVPADALQYAEELAGHLSEPDVSPSN